MANVAIQRNRIKIFNTWRVPERITESCPSVRSKLSAQYNPRETKSTTQLPRINSRDQYTLNTERCGYTETRNPERDYIHNKCKSARDPVQYNLTSNEDVNNTRLVSPQYVIPRASRQAKIQQMMRFYMDREPVNQKLSSLVDSLKKATDAERDLIEKALRLGRGRPRQDSGDIVDGRSFNEWFKSATAKEREDAMRYLNNLDDNKYQESSIGLRHHTAPSHSLAEKRRAAQTWHHLPVQRYKAVTNRGAMYSEPQKVMARHYVIHPDWG